MTLQPLKQYEGAMTQDFVTRPEMTALVEGLNRELSGLGVKMDQILDSKFEDARSMGVLQEQVRGLADDVKGQAVAIRRIEQESGKIKSGVKDDALKIAWEVIKFLGALVIGYMASGKLHLP